MKFKPGDKVVLVDKKDYGLVNYGEKYTVERVQENGKFKLMHNSFINYDPARFKLASYFEREVVKCQLP